jgi:D-glycero-alpha-D-manno-heptose-7-phosphate kinase
MMVISRTPLRVSFAGGGTDLKSYYQHNGGAVTSTAIKKHMYVTVNTKFDDSIRVSYSKTEFVDNVDDLQHELVKEAMKKTGVTKGIEITTIADVPSRGTGLGSSSSLTVGLLNALYAYKGIYRSPANLAREACEIEIDALGAPIGKQDQYAAAFGGINFIEFKPDDNVHIRPVVMTPDLKKRLQNNLMMFYTGLTRKANTILSEQNQNTDDKMKQLDNLKDLSKKVLYSLGHDDVDGVGKALHEGWLLKKQLASKITNPDIDEMYNKAIEAGAIGGKVLGAGGGGFLLVYVREEDQHHVRLAMKGLKEMDFKLEPEGSKIIYVEE